MKNLIFLSQRRFEFYDLKDTTHQVKRMVLILSESARGEFPEEYLPYFQHIYTVPLHPGKNLFDKMILDLPAVKAAVENEIEIAGSPANLNFVCSDEFNLELIGLLRDQYKIPGAGAEQLKLYRDKLSMKQRLKESGIRLPRYSFLDLNISPFLRSNYYHDLVKTIADVLVIKPISGAGSISTEIIENEQQFTDLYPKLQHSAMLFEVEEYIKGTMFHCESIISNQQIIFWAANEYLYPNHYYHQGCPLMSFFIDPESSISKRIGELNAQVLKTLGFIDGLSHLELFHTPQDELVFIEVAARMPGGGLNIHYKEIFNLDLGRMDMLIQAGKIFEPLNLPIKTYSFVAQIPVIKGKIVELIEPDLKSPFKSTWNCKVGDLMTGGVVGLRDFSVRFTVWNDNYDILREDFEYFRHYKAVKTITE